MHQIKTYELTSDEFENIFERLYEPLCILAYKYVNDIGYSEDIVQNVFLKIFEDKVAFSDKNKVDGFFYTAVKNKSLDFLRSKYAKDIKAYSAEEMEALQTEEYYLSEVTTIKTLDIIKKVIKLLPNKCAEAIRLSIEDYTNKEIAEEMNISIYTVKEYKKTAYKKLREALAYLR